MVYSYHFTNDFEHLLTYSPAEFLSSAKGICSLYNRTGFYWAVILQFFSMKIFATAYMAKSNERRKQTNFFVKLSRRPSKIRK